MKKFLFLFLGFGIFLLPHFSFAAHSDLGGDTISGSIAVSPALATTTLNVYVTAIQVNTFNDSCNLALYNSDTSPTPISDTEFDDCSEAVNQSINQINDGFDGVGSYTVVLDTSGSDQCGALSLPQCVALASPLITYAYFNIYQGSMLSSLVSGFDAQAFVTTQEVDTYGSNGVFSGYTITQTYNPFEAFWVLVIFTLGFIWIVYKISCMVSE